ncbi:protein kinase [Candidatus Dependentiae bacterium]|nr:protein kinase [Candidatus Dependentiae bacterium]MBU4387232.1 protein kinase [Candidatus Dependentiae bacterium]MCG2756142.1 protein kinase [Candidatus Dependentiae bacterium]
MDQCTNCFKLDDINRNYTDKDLIGEGANKKVYKVFSSDSIRSLALVVYKPGKYTNIFFENELFFLNNSEYKHPNIITLYDFDEVKKEFLMECGGTGNLRYFIRNCRNKRIQRNKVEKATTLSKKIDYLITILSIIVFLHDKNIILRDLKPDNLIFVRGVLKLIDLESLIIIPKDKTYVKDGSFSMTIPYVDPAIYGSKLSDENGICYYACYLENDIYSIATLIFYVIYENDFFYKFVENKVLESKDPEFLSEEKDLVKSVKNILEDFNKIKKIMKKYLLNQGERLNLNEIDFFYKGLEDLSVKDRINNLIEKCWGFILDRPSAKEILAELIEIKKIVDDKIKKKKYKN